MRKNTLIKIPIEIYHCTLYVYFGEAVKFNVALELMGFDPIDPDVFDGGLSGMRKLNPIIWLPHIPCSYGDFDSLAHEIFHAANNTLESRGFKLSTDSHEAWAYLTGYMTGKIYEKLLKK